MGLFGFLSNVRIQNLTVEGNINLAEEQGCQWVGGLVGKLEGTNDQRAALTGCTSRVELSCSEADAIGGLAGRAKARITSCRNEGAVTTSQADAAGGIVGMMEGCSGRLRQHRRGERRCAQRRTVCE